MPPSTHRFVSAVVASLVSCALLSCAVRPPARNAPGDWPIIDVAHGALVSEDALVDVLAPAPFRLLGEEHDDSAHHVVRARLVTEIARRGLRPSVVFEQFDLEHDPALVAAQTSSATPDALATAGELDRKGWRWPLHEPIVAAALAMHLPIRAGNLSRTAMRAQTAAGLPESDATGAPRWLPRLRAAPWSEVQARELREDIVESHCNMLPANVVPRLVEAERMRDAAMAQALIDDATAGGAILIAGNGHVRKHLGVPDYLHAPGLVGANATSISVGFVETQRFAAHGDGDVVVLDRDEIARIVAANPGFDYLWVTPRIERADPCTELRGTKMS